MDARVARLEAHVEILRADSAATRADVAGIRVSLATLTERAGISAAAIGGLTDRSTTSAEQMAILKERVAHLPSKGFVVTSTGVSLTFLGSLILFGEKLKALAGI